MMIILGALVIIPSIRWPMAEPAAIRDRIDRPTPAWMSCKIIMTLIMMVMLNMMMIIWHAWQRRSPPSLFPPLILTLCPKEGNIFQLRNIFPSNPHSCFQMSSHQHFTPRNFRPFPFYPLPLFPPTPFPDPPWSCFRFLSLLSSSLWCVVGLVCNFSIFSRSLRTVLYPTEFGTNIQNLFNFSFSPNFCVNLFFRNSLTIIFCIALSLKVSFSQSHIKNWRFGFIFGLKLKVFFWVENSEEERTGYLVIMALVVQTQQRSVGAAAALTVSGRLFSRRFPHCPSVPVPP